MKYVVIDLEMNGTRKGEICRNEIIEIGAVVLDENFCRVSEFMTYVKPELNDHIDKKISRLTGITDIMVENAPSFANAFKMFASFCDSLNDNIEIYAWSDSDKIQLEKEAFCKNYAFTEEEQKIMDSMYDFQKEFDEMLNLDRNVSLKDALMYAGLDFEGRAHDALFDARNTAELLTVARNENLRKDFLDKSIEYLTPKNCSNTLGDLFDFSIFANAI